MSFDLLHMWSTMGFGARLIAGFLLLMGVASLTIMVERAWVLMRTVARSRKFAEEVMPLLEKGDFDGARAFAESHKGSHLALVVASTLKAYLHRSQGQLSPVERASRELDRCMEQIGAQLRRGLSLLASVGSVAPFVGLLGTVVGIIAAFQGIAATGSGGLSAVSAGISEALVETALGLVVAIPAVLIFNVLSTRIDNIESSLQQAGGRLIDDLEDRHHGDVRQQRAA